MIDLTAFFQFVGTLFYILTRCFFRLFRRLSEHGAHPLAETPPPSRTCVKVSSALLGPQPGYLSIHIAHPFERRAILGPGYGNVAGIGTFSQRLAA
jgi:hypothetical protein